MTATQAEALFSTKRLDIIFLSPELAADADCARIAPRSDAARSAA